MGTRVDERWRGLRNALAGLFCASLGSLDELRTTSPEQSFVPEGSLPNWETSHKVRHASLPSEHVCTENLTPFLKLLPCKSQSGIASLLNPHRLFDADWHGMGVHVLWREEEGVELRLTFQAVFDPLRSGSVKKQGWMGCCAVLITPLISPPLDWSLQSLFDRNIHRSCPAARTSQVVSTLPTDVAYSISPEPSSIEGNVAIFDVKSRKVDTLSRLFTLTNIHPQVVKPLDIKMEWANSFSYRALAFQLPQASSDLAYCLALQYLPDSVPFSVKRTLRGSSQAWGQLSVVITNYRPSAVHALYLETMPWLLQFLVHTLEAQVDGTVRGSSTSRVLEVNFGC